MAEPANAVAAPTSTATDPAAHVVASSPNGLAHSLPANFAARGSSARAGFGSLAGTRSVAMIAVVIPSARSFK